jgi:lipopolysaccharide export system permease protein
MLIYRYIAREILLATGLVLLALLSLLVIYDFIRELGDIGKAAWSFQGTLIFIALEIPSHIALWLPVAGLIGALFALSRLSEQSELTVMRTAGLSLARLAFGVGSVGVLIGIASFLLAEFVAPHTQEYVKLLRLKATSAIIAGEFRSGFWLKDDRRYVNVGSVTADAEPRLMRLRIYEFDPQFRLLKIIDAKEAQFIRGTGWQLTGVTDTAFNASGSVEVTTAAKGVWATALAPDVLASVRISPDQMSLQRLTSYVDHLRNNQQKSERYEIAFWNKLAYPFAAVIMVLLAIPFSLTSNRKSGVGLKIVIGILIGLGFHFASRLVSHMGLLNDWSPLVVGLAPSALFLLAAMYGIAAAERR